MESDESEEVIVMVNRRRGRKRPLSIAQPQQQQERGQQSETLEGPDNSVAASADGEHTLSGPLIIAAVIGCPLGRWGELFAPTSASAPQSVLQSPAVATGRDTGNACREDTQGLPALHGFMVVRSWQWSSSQRTSSSVQEERMTSVLQHVHCRSSHLEILRHDILCVAALPEPLLIEQLDLSRLPPDLGELFADKAKHSSFTVMRHGTAAGAGQVIGFANLRSHWASTVDTVTEKHVYSWPLCKQLANQIVHGHWKLDLSAVTPRVSSKFWRAPVQPSRRQLHMIRASRRLAVQRQYTDVTDVASATSGPSHKTNKQPYRGDGAVVGTFDPEHKFRAVEDAKNLKSQKSLKETMVTSVRLGLPSQEKALADAMERRELEVPCRTILTQGRVKLDVAAMLASRELYSRRGPLFRYLASDASPQVDQSVEVFVSVERIVLRSAVTGKAMSNISPNALVERLLPICTLGHCRTELASKVMTQAGIHNIVTSNEFVVSTCSPGPCVNLV